MASANPWSLDGLVAELAARPIPTSDLPTRAPTVPGLYAWWALPSALPHLGGRPHPIIPRLRLFYIGIATRRLRTRLASNHLRRSGSSTLRRTLAGLLLDNQQYRTRWTDRVVLIDDDEARLTDWMAANLRVSWCTHPAPKTVEKDVVQAMHPPLNVEFATGPTVELITAARRRYYASAGEQPHPSA